MSIFALRDKWFDFRGFSLKYFDRRGFRISTKSQVARVAIVPFLRNTSSPSPIFNWSPVDREAYEFLPVCTSEIKTNSTLPAFRARRDSLEIALRFSSCCIPWRMRVCMWVCNHEHFFAAHVESYSYYCIYRTQGRKSEFRSVLESPKTVALNYQDCFNIGAFLPQIL